MYSFAICSIIVFLLALNIVSVSSQTGDSYNSKINFYRGPTLSDYAAYDLLTAENVVNEPLFSLTRTTMIFIHGWIQSPSSPASQLILNAFLGNGTFNTLALDWSQAAADTLENARTKVEQIGIAFARLIDRMNTQKGVQFQKVYLIGHSLGAHLAGSAGKYTQGWSGKTKYIGRITGLDPAFTAVDFLQWRYATFVDIIHTDAGGLGTNQNNGHVDFYPNGGTAVQPGCTTTPITPDEIACSHVRAINYFAESVVRANRNTNFVSINNANNNINITMGLGCPTTNVQGVYSLTTNAASWYSKS